MGLAAFNRMRRLQAEKEVADKKEKKDSQKKQVSKPKKKE